MGVAECEQAECTEFDGLTTALLVLESGELLRECREARPYLGVLEVL